MKISIRIPDQLLSDVDKLNGKNRTQKIINCLQDALEKERRHRHLTPRTNAEISEMEVRT